MHYVNTPQLSVFINLVFGLDMCSSGKLKGKSLLMQKGSCLVQYVTVFHFISPLVSLCCAPVIRLIDCVV